MLYSFNHESFVNTLKASIAALEPMRAMAENSPVTSSLLRIKAALEQGATILLPGNSVAMAGTESAAARHNV